MKLIIDISEKEYKFIKDLQFYSSGRRNGKTIEKHVINAIKNGTPYNPSGDLISREDLKNDISEKVCDKFEKWNKLITLAEFETFIRDIIGGEENGS